MRRVKEFPESVKYEVWAEIRLSNWTKEEVVKAIRSYIQANGVKPKYVRLCDPYVQLYHPLVGKERLPSARKGKRQGQTPSNKANRGLSTKKHRQRV